jgi:hypothetical protein
MRSDSVVLSPLFPHSSLLTFYSPLPLRVLSYQTLGIKSKSHSATRG